MKCDTWDGCPLPAFVCVCFPQCFSVVSPPVRAEESSQITGIIQCSQENRTSGEAHLWQRLNENRKKTNSMKDKALQNPGIKEISGIRAGTFWFCYSFKTKSIS